MDMGGGGGGTLSNGISACSRRICEGISDHFPAGLRVLVVDDDPICLMILEKMLRNCLYEVTTCSRAVVALSMLRERKGGFDLVMSDVYMPDMDGFKLLEHIGLEMDLPVIMMSADDGKDVVMKGVTHGACDYLIKPVRIEAIKNIWQHVVRKRRNELKDLEQSGSAEDSDRNKKQLEDSDYASSANEGSWRYSKKRKDSRDEEDEGGDREDSSTLKKPRVVWTAELHQQFVAAVNQLSIDKAVPKKILELMNVPGLTRENVASHLQKYRSYLRRLSGVPQLDGGVNTSFVGTPETTIGSISSLGLDLQQAFAISNQLPPHNIAAIGLRRTTATPSMGISIPDQMNHFTDAQIANASNIRYGPGEQLGSKQVNLLHGIPINMEPKQLMHLYQPVESFENMSLQGNEEMSNFPTSPTSLRTSSSSHRDIFHGHQNSSSMMQMPRQGHQLPDSQSQSKMQADISEHMQSRGMSLDENAGGHNLELPSSVGQQLISNDNLGLVSERNAIVMNGRGTSSGGTCIYNPSYLAVSQASSVDFPFCHTMELTGNGFDLASTNGLSSFPSARMFEVMPAIGNLEGLENGTSLKASSDVVPSYNHFNEHHIKNEDWELQNSNITYDVTQHMNSMTRNPDFSPSALGHQCLTASQHGRQNGITHFSGKGMVSQSAENECGHPESIAQCQNNLVVDSCFRVKAGSLGNVNRESMLVNQNFIQEDLINAFLKQQQGVRGEAELNFDGYSVEIPE